MTGGEAVSFIKWMSKPVTPLLTADIIIELGGQILLIERLHEPLGYALPGGFVDVGETVEAAAIREAKEETGLDVELQTLLGVYSDPARDPRGHTVSCVFIATAEGQTPQAGDDAGSVHLYSKDGPWPKMAFDHQKILEDYTEFRKTITTRKTHRST